MLIPCEATQIVVIKFLPSLQIFLAVPFDFTTFLILHGHFKQSRTFLFTLF